MIDLDVAKDVVLERLASRRVCDDCQANYSVDAPPKYGWVCDNCGGDVVQREDDTPAAIEMRLAEYETNTAPLIEWYGERDLLEVIDGWGRTDDVTSNACSRSSTSAVRAEPAGRHEAGAPWAAATPTRSARCAGPAVSSPRCTTCIRAALTPGIDPGSTSTPSGVTCWRGAGPARTSSATTATRR